VIEVSHKIEEYSLTWAVVEEFDAKLVPQVKCLASSIGLAINQRFRQPLKDMGF
jgi:hypothetical protein